MRDRIGLAGSGAGFDQVSAAGFRQMLFIAARTAVRGNRIETGPGVEFGWQVQRIVVDIADFHFLFPFPLPADFS